MSGIFQALNYGKVEFTLKSYIDKKNMTRNKLATLAGVNYDVIDRYYKRSANFKN